MEFFDGWKSLNARFDNGDLTASAQLVGYKIFVIFDEHRFPDSLPISDRELMSRTGIQSGRTIVEARRKLKNAGLIDFKTSHGKTTRYRLVSTKEALSKQLVSTTEAVGGNAYIRARDHYSPIPLNEEEADARAGVQAGVRVNEEMDIHDVWQYETGCPLTGSVAYELERLANEDFDGVHKAIIEAVKSKTTREVRYNFFKKIYEDMKKPKGAVKNGGYSYAIPVDKGDEPWLNY